MHGRAVDVADARADLAGDAQPPRGIAGEDGGGQAIVAVVGQFDGVGLVARVDHADDRAEAFVAKQLHLARDTIDDMGGHQDIVRGFPAHQQARAMGQRIVDQRPAMGDRFRIDHRAQRGGSLARVADGKRLDLGLEAAGEFVGNGIDDDDPLGAHADLALVHEGPEGRRLDRFIEVGILQHHQRGLAAQFEQAGFQMVRRAPGDDPAHRGRAGEVDAAHFRRVDQRAHHRARVGRGIGDDLHHALGKPGVGKGLDDQGMGARALFGGLEDHRIAAGQRRGDGPHPQNDRRIPRRNAQDHADRFAQGHGQAPRLV